MVFKRQSNDFADILDDKFIKKNITSKIHFYEHLILEFNNSKAVSYALLKYGDDTISMTSIVTDRTPVLNVDYSPDSDGYWKPSS